MRVPAAAWAAALATACGGGSPAGAPPPAGAPVVTISMTEYRFTPAADTVQAGTVVQWRNAGTVAHTATSDPGDSLHWDSGALTAPSGGDPYGGGTAGGAFAFAFEKPGTYPYHCTFHGATNGMRGSITVTP
jgi:plastocyanin